MSGPQRRPALALVPVIVLAGCSIVGGSGSVPPASSQAPTLAPTEALEPSPTPGPRFTWDKSAVVTTDVTGLTDLYLNPGALIDSGGLLHLFPNSFSTWPAKMRVPHLTSTDAGASWTLDADAPVLSGDDNPLETMGIDVSTGYVAPDGTWTLVFETVTTSTPWVLGQITGPGPQGPWTWSDEPILEGGAAGTFDVGGVQWPSVVEHDGKLLMYFAGFTAVQGGNGSIGLATLGADGTWTKREQPVLTPTERWEGRSVDRPRVVSTPGGLVMVYAGRDLTDRGIATSQDGITWTKVPGPAIERDDFPVGGRSWDAALHHADGSLLYLLEIGSQTTSVYRATLAWP